MKSVNQFQGIHIDRGAEIWRDIPGAVLLDVRTTQEYGEGHIPGSINLPFHLLNQVEQVAEGKDAPLFVYCHSGARSGRAMKLLNIWGYNNAVNLGGLMHYSGPVEK